MNTMGYRVGSRGVPRTVGPSLLRARRPASARGRPAGAPSIDTELERDALTAPAGVSYDSAFEGFETKGLSRWTRKP